jgi:hypothetical protein
VPDGVDASAFAGDIYRDDIERGPIPDTLPTGLDIERK